jgi:tripartite-type tricarboxylate transporter receptor subunit TctC
MSLAIRLARFLLLVAGICAHPFAAAQVYPSRPIHVVIGYGPGGPTDVIHRLVANEASKRLGQPVIVENRPGASGMIAATAVKNAAPDGYTLFGGSATAVSPVYIKDGLLASKELAPIATVGLVPIFMYVTGNLGVGTLKEFVAWTKANPGKLRFGASSTSATMLMALMSNRLGITFENIPYKTTDQVAAAMVANDVQVSIQAESGFKPLLDSGKVRGIAVLSQERYALAPSIPTATEQGIPLVLRFNQGLWAPLGTPREIIGKLNSAVNESLRNPEVAKAARNTANEIALMTPEEVLKTFESEMAFYTEAAALIGFKPQ